MTATTGTATPVRTTADVVERVREAVARATPLRIVGRGGWLDAGHPVRAAHVLALDGLTGIVDYTPGDLTLTARAGTPLAEIARATMAERQWLALDPFGSPHGTLGATVATASAGPLAHAFGTPRDNVLGLEAVTGDARVIRGGGRVVKNVAGFDLTRLLTGSWGTLGVITEVTVRLRALPEVEESWAIATPDDPPALDALLARLRTASVAPLAAELLNPALAARLALGDRPVLLLRLGANAESVRAQREQVAMLGDARPAPSEVWSALRECEPPGAAVLRCSALPSRLPETWTLARRSTHAVPDALLHASVGRGIVRCIIPPDAPTFGDAVRALRAFDGTVIAERLPAEHWFPSKSDPVRDRLARDVARAFDPHRVLNPGILELAP